MQGNRNGSKSKLFGMRIREDKDCPTAVALSVGNGQL
jgi:hypothetical protein